jgi:hypothetical protein
MIFKELSAYPPAGKVMLALIGFFLTTCCQERKVSGFSPAAGPKNGRSNRRRKLNGINIQFSDNINRMDRINILNQKNPDNPVNPV